MRAFLFVVLLLGLGADSSAAQPRPIIAEVREAIAQRDFARGEKIVEAHRAAHGVTPEMLEALSWLGRGALAAKQWDSAERYATQTYDLARAALKGRSVDQERHLPIALGAAIEVLAHVRAERGARSEAVHVLNQELGRYKNTSLVKRIQKNIHLLSLEGKPAPAIDVAEDRGRTPAPSLDALKGKPVILFFWAHWCGDCKTQGPILARLLTKYGKEGLTVFAPTQRYGYVAGGQPASADEEARYIEQVRQTHYSFLGGPVPLSAANHERYGVSTTPTLVLVDRDGIVRLYHPGRMTEEALEPLVRRLVGAAASSDSFASLSAR